MIKKIVCMSLLLIMTGCGSGDNVYIDANYDRIDNIEKRLALLEQIVELDRTELLQKLIDEKQERISEIDNILDLLSNGYVTQQEKNSIVDSVMAILSGLGTTDDRLRQDILDLVDMINDIEPTIINEENYYDYSTVNNTYNNKLYLAFNYTIQEVADLSDIKLKLSELRNKVHDNGVTIERLEYEILYLKSLIDSLQNGTVSGTIKVIAQSDGTTYDNKLNRIKIVVKNVSNYTLYKFKITSTNGFTIEHIYGDSVSFSRPDIVTRGGLITPGMELTLTIDLDQDVNRHNLPVFSIEVL